MSLQIAVCIKPVPDPEHYDKVTIDTTTKRITRVGIPMIINPVDKSAIEKALKLKDTYGGKVTVITMSIPESELNLREALAMGADSAVLLTDRAFAGADTLATSYILAEAIKKIGDIDIILTGSESADGATAQVPSQLGEWLNIPHLWNVFEAEAIEERKYHLKTKYENGHMEWECELPIVIGVSREIAKPRYVGAMGIIKAKSKPIQIWGRAELQDADDKYIGLLGSPTKPGAIKTPDIKRAGIKFDSKSIEGVAADLLEKIRAGGINVW